MKPFHVIEIISYIVGIVFVTLKLTDNLDLSWPWTLAPFWLPITTFFVVWILSKLLTHPK